VARIESMVASGVSVTKAAQAVGMHRVTAARIVKASEFPAYAEEIRDRLRANLNKLADRLIETSQTGKNIPLARLSYKVLSEAGLCPYDVPKPLPEDREAKLAEMRRQMEYLGEAVTRIYGPFPKGGARKEAGSTDSSQG
jgi:hypothetical protein